MKNLVKKILGKIVNGVAASAAGLRLINYIHENGSTKTAFWIEHLLNQPAFDFKWDIKIDEKQKAVYTFKQGEPYLSFHFPLSYKRNDPALRQTEKILHSFYSADAVYFDVGANIGLRSIYYLSKGRTCYLFEPNQGLKKYTERFVAQNNITNATLVTGIVGDTDGKKEFYFSKSSYASSVSKESLISSGDTIQAVDTVESFTLDSFAVQHNVLAKAKIIKIDVEGHEYEVCTGAQQLLQQEGICLIIEVLPNTPSSRQLFDLLTQRDYKIFAIHFSGKLKFVPCYDSFPAGKGTIDFLITKNYELLLTLKPYMQSA